ncbi:MAG: PTS sugar transporter subunit IIA [Mariprofundaceae bacterium]
MIGMILVAHGEIGAEMLKAVEHVVGPQALAKTLSVNVEDDVDTSLGRLKEMIVACNVGKGVLLMADMFGGTPCNLALACMRDSDIEVLSGFNLPMLIKVATLRQSIDDLRLLAGKARDSGRYHMHFASEILAQGKNSA